MRVALPYAHPTHPLLFEKVQELLLLQKEIHMSKRNVSITSIFFLILLSAAFLAACGSSGSTPVPSAPSSGGTTSGQALMQARCSVCHSTDRITSAHKTAADWKTTVDRMISHGAQLTPQEEQTLVDYLATTYK